ncbi:MAG TPA: DUF6049 family protein [Nocardioidaceae bacterium]|nr:DUF6049 family protein [Nocardioidaceae bacterium]
MRAAARELSVRWLRRGLTGLLALAVGVLVTAVLTAVLTAVAADATDSAGARHKTKAAPTLTDQTGLSVTIDSIEPTMLTPGEPLTLSGIVHNASDRTWFNAQVYLEMSVTPATDKAGLDAFALTGDTKFGDRVVRFGDFAQIGPVEAGKTRPYQLTVPYARLPAVSSGGGSPGVYQVAAAVLATQGGTRDTNADARTDALVPLEDPSNPPRHTTALTTLIPITAPVALQSDGVFAGDALAEEVAPGGRLRNLLDLVLDAPTPSLDIVVDPALVSALENMADGYQYVDLADGPNAPPTAGAGQQSARAWLDDFAIAAATENVDYLPWANPNTSGLAAAGMHGVAEAAINAAAKYASDQRSTAPVVDWQSNGAATRRGLSVADRAGGRIIHVVSQSTLSKLEPDDSGFPPSLATVNTRTAPLLTTVTRSDLAGFPFTRSTTAVEFRQGLVSEALVRAIGQTDNPTSVIAAPFHWDPGVVPIDLNLPGAYGAGFISPRSLGSLTDNEGDTPVSYVGPIQPAEPRPAMTAGLENAIQRLRDSGRVYTALLTDGRDAATSFEQQLAQSGSSAWLWQPKRGEAITRRAARAMTSEIRQVTLTGPEFVALSSEAGRFPLTVSNGLDVSVTVNVSVVPRNPALHIDPIDPVVLDPGQRQLIEVRTRASGSGVTAVEARLATREHREFGNSWNFDVRATRIGVAIWILLGVLMAGLFGGAAIRIVRRFRTGGFRPRGQQSP